MSVVGRNARYWLKRLVISVEDGHHLRSCQWTIGVKGVHCLAFNDTVIYRPLDSSRVWGILFDVREPADTIASYSANHQTQSYERGGHSQSSPHPISSVWLRSEVTPVFQCLGSWESSMTVLSRDALTLTLLRYDTMLLGLLVQTHAMRGFRCPSSPAGTAQPTATLLWERTG